MPSFHHPCPFSYSHYYNGGLIGNGLLSTGVDGDRLQLGINNLFLFRLLFCSHLIL